MKGLYFTEDKYLESLNLDEKIKKFINNLEHKYESQVIDEIFIINYNWEKIIPIYFLCAHKNCNPTEIIDQAKSEQIKEQKLKDFAFFIDNILNKLCLINHEWMLAKDQIWCLFDWMFRMDDYYIGINNSEKSLRELFDWWIITEEDLIKEMKLFYNDLGIK